VNSALMFSKATDEWSTPQDTFDALDAEFWFSLAAAASDDNHKRACYMTQDMNALACDWLAAVQTIGGGAVWLNPPYSKCREFIAKAAEEARKGCTVVCLVPSRTDTRWWHAHVWDAEKHQPRRGVEVRFIKGRLKFGGASQGAPFPSVVIVFRPEAA